MGVWFWIGTSRQYGGYRRHKKKIVFFNFNKQNVNEYGVLRHTKFVAGEVGPPEHVPGVKKLF